MTKAQTVFRKARPEITELLRAAKFLSEEVPVQRRMSQQESQLRLIVVALIGAMQSYVSELLEEKADELGDDWDELDRLQKQYVATQTRRRISSFLNGCKENDLAQPAKITSLRDAILECAEWHRTPSSLTRSVYRARLDGFLKDNGGSTLDRTISRYGKCGMTFFDWLAKHDSRFRGVEDALNIIIATRNDVAHGNFERRVTLRDARLHRILVYRLVAKIERYMVEENVPAMPPDSPQKYPTLHFSEE